MASRPSATTLPGVPAMPAYAAGGSVELLRDETGSRRRVRFAEIARSNPWVMASVNERASLASRVPIHVFRPVPAGRDGHRERVRVGDDGAGEGLARLLAHPEPRLSGRRLRRRVVGDLLVHSNALLEKVRQGGQVVGLRWQPWLGVDPLGSDDGLSITAWRVPVQRRLGWLQVTPPAGPWRTIDAEDAIHVTLNDDTETPLGVSLLESLHATHALHEAAWRFARHYLEEGAFPSGVVEISDRATLEQAKLTRELIQELHTGVHRGGRPAVIGFGKWQQVTATPEGAKLVELARESRNEVAGAYRMAWLGNLEDQNRATAEQARKAFIRDVVGEDVGVIETEINAQLVSPRRRWSEAGVFVEAQLGELLRPDMEAMSDVIHKQVGAPVMTINEGRRLLNLPPLDRAEADRITLAPGTPGAGDGPSGQNGSDDGHGVSELEDFDSRVEMAAALVRAGFVAESALQAVGIDPIEYHGVLPVTVQSPADDGDGAGSNGDGA